MSEPSSLSERLQRAFVATDRGVVGLVDDLLELCREQGLRFDWQASHCRVHSLGFRQPEMIQIPLPRSVFRAILARIAALCNQRAPNSVSPYGGESELLVDALPATVFRVAFTNNPGEQQLEVWPIGSDGTALKAGTDQVPAQSSPGH